VAFYAALFSARTEVYALRWDNACTGRSGWMPAVRGGWRKGRPAAEPEYLPLTSEVLTAHLSGGIEIGLYPMLDGDRCRWLAADFDGPAAMLDALAYLKAGQTGWCAGGAGSVPGRYRQPQGDTDSMTTLPISPCSRVGGSAGGLQLMRQALLHLEPQAQRPHIHPHLVDVV